MVNLGSIIFILAIIAVIVGAIKFLNHLKTRPKTQFEKRLNDGDFFSNNGEKTKQWAKSFLTISLIVGAAIMVATVAIITVFDDDLVPIAIIAAVVEGLASVSFSIIAARLIYGFGELVTNSYGNVRGNDTFKNKKTNGKTSMLYDDIKVDENEKDDQEEEKEKYFRCPKCNTLVKFGDNYCSNCNAAFDWNKN